MAEYIDKDIAVKGLRMAHDLDGADFVANIPAANVRENVISAWVRCDKHIVKCPKCGNFLDLRGVNAGRGDANFCPNCGAQMGGSEDG